MKNYKNIIKVLLLSCMLVSIDLFAQVPKKISYQAIVRDSNNELIKNTNISVKISIGYYVIFGLPPRLNFVTSYSETHNITTNENGLLSLEIGGGDVTFGKFDSIAWGKNTFYLQTEIDPDGGSDYTISSTTQILSVPYSIYAEHTNTADTSNFAKNGLIAYGNINQDGTINIGSGNFTVEKSSTGIYYIKWNNDSGIKTFYTNSAVFITPVGSTPKMVSFSSGDGGKTLVVYITNDSGNYVDSMFAFTVVKLF